MTREQNQAHAAAARPRLLSRSILALAILLAIVGPGRLASQSEPLESDLEQVERVEPGLESGLWRFEAPESLTREGDQPLTVEFRVTPEEGALPVE